MLINCTESPYQEWTREMLDKVESTYGLIKNHTLPDVNKNMTDEDIDLLAESNYEKIITIIDEKSDKVKQDVVFLEDHLPMHDRVKEYLLGNGIECLEFEAFKDEDS